MSDDDYDGIGVSPELGGINKSHQSPHPLVFLDRFFPEKDEIEMMGRLERPLTVLLSTAESVFDFYPEVEHLRPHATRWLSVVEKRLTSVDGKSRKEYETILSSLFSGYRADRQDARESSFFRDIFDAGGGSSDDE